MKKYKEIRKKIQNFGSVMCGCLYELKNIDEGIPETIEKRIRFIKELTEDINKDVSKILNPRYYKESMFIDWDKLDDMDYKNISEAYMKFCSYAYQKFEKRELRKLLNHIKSFDFGDIEISYGSFKPTKKSDYSFKHNVLIKEVNPVNQFKYRIYFQFELIMEPDIGIIKTNGAILVEDYKYDIISRGQFPGFIKGYFRQMITEKTMEKINTAEEIKTLQFLPPIKKIIHNLTQEEPNDYKEMKSVGDIFIYFKLLMLLKEHTLFRDWLKNYHSLDMNPKFDKSIFKGFHYLILSTWKALINEFDQAELLDMKEDEIYFRGYYYQDIHSNVIPISCEKTSFIKCIINLGKSLRNAKNWTGISLFFKQAENFLNLLQKIYESNVKSYMSEKKDALKSGIIFVLYDKYHDIHRGKPRIWINIFYQSNEKPKFLIDAFRGYIYTLQYIWYKILDEDTFKKSIVSNLHEIIPELDNIQKYFEEFLIYNFSKTFNKELKRDAKPIYSSPMFIDSELSFNEFIKRRTEFFKDCYNIIKKNKDKLKIGIQLVNHLKSQKYSDEKRKLLIDIKLNLWEKKILLINNFFSSKGVEKLFSIKIWDSFNLYRYKIHLLTQKYPRSTYFKRDKGEVQFFITGYIDKDQFKDFFLKIDNEIFIEKNFKNSKIGIKNLEARMLYYDVEILNSRLGIFSGVQTFISSLVGDIKIRKNYGNKEKIKVKLFKHPSINNQGDISLGLLIIYTTQTSDYSGWLIFYNCGKYGYVGTGPSNYELAIHYINKYREYINFEEIIISHKTFRRYLKFNRVSDVFHVLNGDEKIKIYLADAKGKLFESFVYKWVNEKGKYDKVKWNLTYSKQEIDVIGFSDNNKKIDIYECKIAIHKNDMEKILENINKKSEAVGLKFTDSNIQKILIVYSKIDQKTIKYYNNSNIKVIENFKNTILSLNQIFPKINKYIKLFESNIKYPIKSNRNNFI